MKADKCECGFIAGSTGCLAVGTDHRKGKRYLVVDAEAALAACVIQPQSEPPQSEVKS